MNLCPTCRKLLYRTDACKGVGIEACGRTDGGSKRLSGGSSAVEQVPSKQTVGGSTPPPRSKKSTAARKDVPGIEGKERVSRSPGLTPRQPEVAPPASDQDEPVAGTQAPPVDAKSKGGRPRIHADRKAYKAQKQREYRAKIKSTP